MTASLTRKLADFAVDPAYDDLPKPVIHAVRRAILDSVGVSVAGARHPAARMLVDMVKGLGTGGRCGIVGSNHRTDAVNAALANGVAAHVLDWDDTILPTRAHLSAALLPALIAESEIQGWTLRQIIPAFAVGFELQARLNHAIYPSVHLRGWQGTGIAGGAGTAAAIGRMKKLDADRIVHAMGIAATNASGLIATFGSMSKPLNIGRAGASGLQSAYLASLGYTSNPDIFGSGRFLEMFDDNPRHEILTGRLGEAWSILENGYKLYPCGFVAHAMIDAVRDLRVKAGKIGKLKRLRLTVSPESTHLMGNADPINELQAKFSLLYDAAVAWNDGHVTPAAFDMPAVRDPRHRSVMAVTGITSSATVKQHEAHARAEFEDGSSLSTHIAHARGTPERPLTDRDLIDKFDAAMVLGELQGGAELASLILESEDVPVALLMKRVFVGAN